LTGCCWLCGPKLPPPPPAPPPHTLTALAYRRVAGRVQSDEPVDPKPALEKLCHEPCKALWDNYKACADRVAKKGDGDCSPWYFDYWKCVDKCVSAAGSSGNRSSANCTDCDRDRDIGK
jgi:hypothetical protein